MTDENSNKFLDETAKQWIENNKSDLESLYKNYCLEYGETEMSFEDFAIYTFYQSEH